jgi:predicted ester cyclase
MISIQNIAEKFVDACETGKGWEACRDYCQPDATFSVQAGALEGVNTLEAYTEWMKGMMIPLTGGSYEVRAFATDEDRKKVIMYGVFRATHTGEGGPVPPTGKQMETDYVYVMDFEGDCIQKMTKIWNDGYATKQLGWA